MLAGLSGDEGGWKQRDTREEMGEGWTRIPASQVAVDSQNGGS